MDIATLREKLKKWDQAHLLAFADELKPAQQQALIRQIEEIDFDQVAKLYQESKESAAAFDAAAVEPIDSISLPRSEADRKALHQAEQAGVEALHQGKVAVVLVAGGQGSRLGFEHPKGMFPIGPVAGTSLFQIHAEKIMAWRMKAGANIPWYIMTSPNNHEETVRYFENHRYFGLPEKSVHFFTQGTMPAVDLESGKVLLAEKGELFSAPDGHGGTLTALRKCGCLDEMQRQGIEHVYYFQVDNAFAKILDPGFLGYHIASDAELSLKVIRKEHATEKLGLVVRYQGKPTIIEYSDLPAELGAKTDAAGALLLWTGSIAIHVFKLSFLSRITEVGAGLPFHFAKKAVPFVDPSGKSVQPEKPNALKFETFIFDCLPMAEKVTVVETDRSGEYEPVKNASGEHSPDVVRHAMTARAAQWLDHAGISYPKHADGTPRVSLEISPLAGLDADDFARNYRNHKEITNSAYFSKEGVEEIV